MRTNERTQSRPKTRDSEEGNVPRRAKEQKGKQCVYRLHRDTGWRINNRITDADEHRGQIRSTAATGEKERLGKETRNPLSGITRQSGTHQRAYFYNYRRRPLICFASPLLLLLLLGVSVARLASLNLRFPYQPRGSRPRSPTG